MKLFSFTSGPYETHAYLVGDETSSEAMVVDAPPGSAAQLAEAARKHRLTIRHIVNTHGHWDHMADNAALKRLTGAALLCHNDDEVLLREPERMRAFGLMEPVEAMTADRHLSHGDTLFVGALAFRVAHCPGHSPGLIVLHEPKEKVCFCGDLIFAGSVGRTDFPGGSWAALAKSIRESILILPDDTRLLCGHGPATTVGRERATNPFVRQILAESQRG
ncbi:MAG: MBL fold metallo-hydrolase [Verrucomicrobia bacterium]|nr:MBL fold metallo-hydrolase [Verrucomicrobiota bacterium]